MGKVLGLVLPFRCLGDCVAGRAIKRKLEHSRCLKMVEESSDRSSLNYPLRAHEEGKSPKSPKKAKFKLGFMGTFMVVLITAMAGTGCAICLLVLVWLLLGGMFVEYLLWLTVLTGLVTLVGIIILTLSKGKPEEEDQTALQSAL